MSKIPCLVCTKPYDGTTHCSVTACRACAMFFKRCLTLDIPLCKSGNNNCNLKEPKKIPCSFCRFEKCLKAGMKYQATSRSLKSKSETQLQNQTIEQHQNKLIFDLQMLVPETMPTLKRYCYNYAVNVNLKKNYEMLLLREDRANLMKLPGNRRMGYMTQSRVNMLWKNDTSELEILQGSFPGFAQIDTDEKDVLIYMIKFLLLDLFTSYRTWKVFGINTNKMICSETMFADFEDMSSYIDDIGRMNPMDVKTISLFFSTSWCQLLNQTLSFLDRIKITDVEYLAVCCLLVWDEDNYLHIPQFTEMAVVHRTFVYKDLDYYYKNILKLDNYVERIMNIKELLRKLKDNLTLMTGCVHFLRAFNYYQGNEVILDASEKVSMLLEYQKKFK